MIFLTRKTNGQGIAPTTRIRLASCLLCAASLALAAGSIGCSTPNISKSPTSLADQPIADEATQLRGFQKSLAIYQTGTTVGYPTRAYYVPDPENTTAFNIVADSVMLIAETFSLPVTLMVDYPFRKVYYMGDVLPNSYTAMPAMAPEKPYGPPNPDRDPLTMGRPPFLPPLPPVPVERPGLVTPPEEVPETAPPATVKPKPIITPAPAVNPKPVVTPAPAAVSPKPAVTPAPAAVEIATPPTTRPSR